MTEPLVFTIVAAPIVLGVVQAFKASPLLAGPRDVWSGIVALTVGVGLGVGWQLYGDPFAATTFTAGIHGLIAGLVASGLWSNGKAAGETVRR